MVSSLLSVSQIYKLITYTMMTNTRTSMEGYTVLLFCSCLLSFLVMSAATDTITVPQPIRDGDTIVSAGGGFELGFFNPGNSAKRYLGIWYKKISIRTVVWVANRDVPLMDSSGVLKVTNQGILQLVNRNETIIWSSNSSRLVLNPVAKLLESGNLVLKDANDDNPENFLWQSFDYPCDTLMPTMKLGRNVATGLDRYLSAWNSTDDPSQSDYTFRLDPHGFPELIASKGLVQQFRIGPWNGLRFSGTPQLKPNPIYKFDFVYNQEEIYYHYELLNSSIITRLVLNQNGVVQRFTWVGPTQGWVLYLTVQIDSCERYALCGAYGSCSINNSPVCGCLKGFVPKFPKDWDMVDWSHGCVRKTPLDCQNGDGFIKYSGLKLPETRHSWFNYSMNLEECKIMCLKNCSCTAYAMLDIKSGIGCLLWFGDLIDITEYTVNGQDIYIRMAVSELDQGDSGKKNAISNGRKQVITVLSTAVLLLGLALVFFVLMKKHNRARKVGCNKERGYTTERQKEDLELPSFDMATLANATNNFSDNNKLGEGGFGPVYKGVLEDGQEIAVKRLSKNSRQGLNEFKNEVIHIAKLQHRNLVKLLGCCIQVDEKMLIYEYMPNKSGYMSPEYAIDGQYSIKSDVFSFGVLLLEVMSGKRNRGFCHPGHHLNLIGHAWRLHIEGRSLELVDASMGNSYNLSEVLRSIHVGLLCVQRSPENRPNMSSVGSMLGSKGSLPRPKQPGFFTERDLVEADTSSSNHEPISANEITITVLYGR